MSKGVSWTVGSNVCHMPNACDLGGLYQLLNHCHLSINLRVQEKVKLRILQFSVGHCLSVCSASCIK